MNLWMQSCLWQHDVIQNTVFGVYSIILEMLLESGNGVFFPQGTMELGI